jgi:uncharacterized DUF497 family protein
VSYEWDPAKARANFAKHGIHFADATSTLEDQLALTIRDPFSSSAERSIRIKHCSSRLLVVTYTWRGDNYAEFCQAAMPRQVPYKNATSEYDFECEAGS